MMPGVIEWSSVLGDDDNVGKAHKVEAVFHREDLDDIETLAALKVQCLKSFKLSYLFLDDSF